MNSYYMSKMSKSGRGALIVLEGCDRSGKSTQCRKLVSALENKQVEVRYVSFPDRSTLIGKVIDQYLTSKVELPDQAIHLLFSANRWELVPTMISLLNEGTTLIVDRYAFSGVAFTAAKGYDVDLCKSSDVGLPQPDKVFLLALTPEEQAVRKGFGEERYEVLSFQQKVMETFHQLKDETWEVIDANRTEDDLQSVLFPSVLSLIEDVKKRKLGKLWQS